MANLVLGKVGGEKKYPSSFGPIELETKCKCCIVARTMIDDSLHLPYTSPISTKSHYAYNCVFVWASVLLQASSNDMAQRSQGQINVDTPKSSNPCFDVCISDVNSGKKSNKQSTSNHIKP